MYLYVIIYVFYKLQVVVDFDLMLWDIYIGWLGLIYDVCVLCNLSFFNNVIVGQYFDVNKYIIVDSVYFLKVWLIILFKDNGCLNIN